MKIIAHRCGTDLYPEQTIAAARYSLENRADLVEVDIRFTADNKPVVIHDRTPAGLYGVDTPVSAMTETEFLALRRTADPSVCGHSFPHYLRSGIDRMLFHCKEGGERLLMILALCREYGIADKVVFGVQSADDVRLLKQADEAVKVLAFMPKAEMTAAFAEAGADYIRLWEKWCTPENLAAVRDTGKKLWIMADSPEVGETEKGCYAFYRDCGADGILVNKVLPAKAFFG